MERTLLLVDNDENITASLVRLLRQDGYRVLTANSAKAALGILEDNAIGVVLTDQCMPEMTGVELLAQARERYPDTVRLVLSGHADVESIKASINQGAIYKYLTKPWDSEMLRSNVHEAFLHYELNQERARLSHEIQEANHTLAHLNLELVSLVEEKSRRIEQIAHYDVMTNLPNRLLFFDRLEEALAQAERKAVPVAAMLLDLDRSL